MDLRSTSPKRHFGKVRYSRTPLIRPPSESHWCGRIRGMVAREGFVYEQKPLSVTRNVVEWEGWSLVRVVVRQGFYCIYIISDETSIFAPQRLPFFKALGVGACTVGKVRASTVFMCVCSTFRPSDFLLFVKNGFVVGARTLNVTVGHWKNAVCSYEYPIV